jgi:hypothetical protein
MIRSALPLALARTEIDAKRKNACRQYAVAEKALQMHSQEGRRFKYGGQLAHIRAGFEKSQSVEY